EGRIAEPDRAIRLHDDVVRRVERLAFDALEAVADDGDRPVMLGAGHPPHAVLAGHQPALPISGVAVGVVRWLAEDADRAGFLLPFEDAVVWDVAPQKRTEFTEPDWAFAPAAAGIEPLDRRVHRRLDRVETRIERYDCGIGIGLGGLPSGGHRGSP